MDKWKIYIAIVPTTFAIIGIFLFQSYNVELPEEELALSVYFIENVTKIESVSIELDFAEQIMRFEGKFYPSGNGIILDSNSKGFQKSDRNCSDDLLLQLKSGGGQGLTWHDKQPVPFTEYGEVDFIEISKTCKFADLLVPNGEFTVHLFGKDQSEGVSIDKIPISILFNSDQYRCRDACVFSDQFDIIDSQSEHGITTVLLEGKNVDTKRMEFDIRTIGVDTETIADLFLIFIQVGVGAVIALILFILSSKQKEKITNVLDQIKNIGIKQQEIIEEQHKVANNKREYACLRIRDRLYDLQEDYKHIDNLMKVSEDMRTKKQTELLLDYEEDCKKLVKELENTLTLFNDVLPTKVLVPVHGLLSVLDKETIHQEFEILTIQIDETIENMELNYIKHYDKDGLYRG